MNQNYDLYEGAFLFLNALLFTLKYKFCPDSLRKAPDTQRSFN